MKKFFRTTAFLAALALMSTGCQKETDNLLPSQDCKQVQYTVAGASHRITLSNSEDWSLFLDNMVALVKEGYVVEIQGGSSITMKYKETVTFTTTSESEVKIWVNNMVSQGYDVTVSYDANTGIFTCIARR